MENKANFSNFTHIWCITKPSENRRNECVGRGLFTRLRAIHQHTQYVATALFACLIIDSMMTNLLYEHLWHLSLNRSLARRHSARAEGRHRAAVRVSTGESGDVPPAVLSEARTSEYYFDYAEIFSSQPKQAPRHRNIINQR